MKNGLSLLGCLVPGVISSWCVDLTLARYGDLNVAAQAIPARFGGVIRSGCYGTCWSNYFFQLLLTSQSR